MKTLRIRLLLLLLVALSLLSSCTSQQEQDRDHDDSGATAAPPHFIGLTDLEVLQGDGIAYREGVKALDADGKELSFSVDASAVDNTVAGAYWAYYRASDARGQETVEKRRITVLEREISFDQLWALVDAEIANQGYMGLSCGDFCENLYYYIKANMDYTASSNKTDWVAEAYRGLTEGNGDCFTYYAMARAFFERLGYSVITVQRTPGLLPTTHYWLLVNTGTEDSPAWYHWDACPHPSEYPLRSILLTDGELLSYHESVPHYYTFDSNLYPPTPKEPFPTE